MGVSHLLKYVSAFQSHLHDPIPEKNGNYKIHSVNNPLRDGIGRQQLVTSHMCLQCRLMQRNITTIFADNRLLLQGKSAVNLTIINRIKISSNKLFLLGSCDKSHGSATLRPTNTNNNLLLFEGDNMKAKFENKPLPFIQTQ